MKDNIHISLVHHTLGTKETSLVEIISLNPIHNFETKRTDNYQNIIGFQKIETYHSNSMKKCLTRHKCILSLHKRYIG